MRQLISAATEIVRIAYEGANEAQELLGDAEQKIYRIATGEERWLDYDRIMPILKDAGFNGWTSIVYEGQDEEAEETAVPKAVSFMRGMLLKHEL